MEARFNPFVQKMVPLGGEGPVRRMCVLCIRTRERQREEGKIDAG